MAADRHEFFRLAAKGFAASTLLYNVNALIHVEDKDDIWFWNQILSKYRPGKYKFLPGSVNELGKHTTGCYQCLKYKDFLSQRFFICIDSDLRYLFNENISAHMGILQTYTYSWENHCCFADALQQRFSELTQRGNLFNFKTFLLAYSEILYKPFLLMLHCERNGLPYFDRNKFKDLISLQYRHGDEKDNAHTLLERMSKEIATIINPISKALNFNFETEAHLYATKGLSSENVYLYIRGHCIYNLLISIGNRLCNGTGIDFEQNILKHAISFNEYDAIDKIQKDVAILKTIRLQS